MCVKVNGGELAHSKLCAGDRSFICVALTLGLLFSLPSPFH